MSCEIQHNMHSIILLSEFPLPPRRTAYNNGVDLRESVKDILNTLTYSSSVSHFPGDLRQSKLLAVN